MAGSQNNVKVFPGWSAMGARHIYRVNRKDHYHPKIVEQEGAANCICKKELVNPTNGLLINTLYDVLNQHMPLLGIVRVTM